MDTESPPGVGVTPHLMVGLLIMLVGVVFTLDSLEILSAGSVLNYWPAGLILIGAAKIWHGRTGHGSSLGGALFVIAGGWMLLRTLDVIDVSIISFWPLLLIVIGGLVVWQSIRGPRLRDGDASDAVVNALAILGGVQRGSNSRQFRGGELTAFMGGCEIDLRNAEIHGEAVIDVFAMWGGIDIRVPENWRVVGRVTPVMGGFEDTTRVAGDARVHTLVIRGMVLMGGVTLKN